jgi:hypothetical protein
MQTKTGADKSSWRISFKEKTGYDCAKWLVNYCLDNNQKLPNFIIHSMNPVGTKNISDYLNDFREFQKK